MKQILGWLTLTVLLTLTSALASADVLLQVTSGNEVGPSQFYGESFVAPSGGPFTGIRYNFFSDASATTPAAAGTAFLLTQEYLGTPANLSSSTAGFVAEATASAGVYTFGSAVALDSGMEYWIYENAAMTTSGSGSGGTSTEHAYFVPDSTSDFSSAGDQVANFRLTGTAAVPEPVGIMLVGVGLAVIASGRKLKQKRML